MRDFGELDAAAAVGKSEVFIVAGKKKIENAIRILEKQAKGVASKIMIHDHKNQNHNLGRS
jgi:hypothetical protein